MNRVPLTIALPSYDHVYEVTSGGVELAGVTASYVDASHTAADVVDLPLADYVVAWTAGDRTMTALPLFLSRAFVHSWIHVRAGAVDVVEPSPTASVYARGLLEELGQRIDAVIAPASSLRETDGVRALFDRPGELERRYYAGSHVFPILSVLAVRTRLLDQHRWLATNIYRAFEVARRRYFARLEDIRGSRVPIPSVAAHLRALREVSGGDIWPYGVEPNRATLEMFMRHAARQGLIADTDVDVLELFAAVETFVDVTDGI